MYILKQEAFCHSKEIKYTDTVDSIQVSKDDSCCVLCFCLPSLTWTLFFVFTFLHLYANFRAVSSVVMETVSVPRLHVLVNEFLCEGRIMTPEEVAIREPVVFGSISITQHPIKCYSVYCP